MEKDQQITIAFKQLSGKMFCLKIGQNDSLLNLKNKVKEKVGYTCQLVFRGQALRPQKDEKTLLDLQIYDGSTLMLIYRLSGGMKAFGTVLFNSMEKQVSIKFNSFAPMWRVVTPGLNLKGKCKNHNCQAKNQVVWIQKGFGTFFINKQVQTSECPKCKKPAQDITNFGYYRCRIKVQGKVKNQKEFKFEDSHNGQEDMKTFAEGDNNLLEWDYLIIYVSKN